jgi:hypothetical protein
MPILQKKGNSDLHHSPRGIEDTKKNLISPHAFAYPDYQSF